MDFFSKKDDSINEEVKPKKSDEVILKEELEGEVEKLQKEFRATIDQIKENEKKLQSVKDEYDFTVTNLMEIKKETNLKKMDLDAVKREIRDIKQNIEDESEKDQENKKLMLELERNEKILKNVKQELEELVKKEKEINEKISDGEKRLQEIKIQETQKPKESGNKSSELSKINQEVENLNKSKIYSEKEEKFIKEQIQIKPDVKGIIEAAGVVTASLKSKLNQTQKEIETIQKLLQKERKEHEETKEKLKSFQNKDIKKKL